MRITSTLYRSVFRTAILRQGGPVPAINGVVKPFKPGGYQDSGADLAYNLYASGEDVAFPVDTPRPQVEAEWSFPDTIAGVRKAVEEKGASVLWANTTLHSRHALVELRSELAKRQVRLVGQNPLDTERFEDKEWINRWLAKHPGLTGSFPASALLKAHSRLADLPIQLPLVLKPVRGRGSHGVTLVRTEAEYQGTLSKLLKESDAVLCEQYLPGQEVTVTVMPPGDYEGAGSKDSYWALPVVERFNHQNGIAPYNGVVAVTQNSRVLSAKEHDEDPAYPAAQKACEHVAALCQATAPIRIDCRRSGDKGPILLFDVNMKPNATGPGRPGREQQASLTTMAAEAIGWDYPTLIVNILRQAKPIEEVIRSS